MQCIKTGCHIWLEEYEEWAYGDAFSMEVGDGEPFHADVYAFHLVYKGFDPARPVKHFTVRKISYWFDYDKTSQDHQSVLISNAVTNHGYEGVPL